MANNQDEARVIISGKSDAYDRVLGKIIEKNKELSVELMKSKEILESLNPVYEELARNAQMYADSLRGIRPPSNMRSFNSGGLNETIGSGGNSGGGSSSFGGGSSSNRKFDANLFDIAGKLKNIVSGNRSLSTVTNVFGMLGNMGMSLFNKMNNLLFSFDEVISIPISLPPLPNLPIFNSMRGSSGGSSVRNPATVPAPALAPVLAFSSALERVPIKSPFPQWQLEFEQVLSRVQSGLAALKFPNIFPNLVTIPVVVTGLDPVLDKLRSVVVDTKSVIEDIKGSIEWINAKIASAASFVETVYSRIVSWFNNPTVQTVLGAVGTLATFIPYVGPAARVVMGARVGMTGLRVANTGSKAAGFGSKAINWGKGLIDDASQWVDEALKGVRGFGSKLGDKIGDLLGGSKVIPSYASGGFHVKPHLGVVGDVQEVTIPLNSPSSKPAYAGIADNLLSAMGNGSFASSVFNIRVGEGANIIADQYSIKRFAQLITDQVQYNLRNTGGLAFNRK